MSLTQSTAFLRIAPGFEPICCPKCSHSMTGTACPKCGLLANRAYVAPLGNSASDELQDAWRAARRDWKQLSNHEYLLRVAGQQNQYVWLASRYREIARRGDDIAIARLGLVQRAAELTLLASMKKVDAEGPAPYRATRRLLIAMLALLLLGLVLARVATIGAH